MIRENGRDEAEGIRGGPKEGNEEGKKRGVGTVEKWYHSGDSRDAVGRMTCRLRNKLAA